MRKKLHGKTLRAGTKKQMYFRKKTVTNYALKAEKELLVEWFYVNKLSDVPIGVFEQMGDLLF